MNVILVGFRGCGKTVVGMRAAERLGLRFIDTDEMIEKEEGRGIVEIFEQDGERTFREIEVKIIRSLEGNDGCVISVGGGAPCSEENRAVFFSLGRVVWLKASPGSVLRRMEGGARPALTSLPVEEEVETLMQKRKNDYVLVADYTIETDNRSEEEVVHELERIWRDIQNNHVR